VKLNELGSLLMVHFQNEAFGYLHSELKNSLASARVTILYALCSGLKVHHHCVSFGYFHSQYENSARSDRVITSSVANSALKVNLRFSIFGFVQKAVIIESEYFAQEQKTDASLDAVRSILPPASSIY
jgi:hypothetical protein